MKTVVNDACTVRYEHYSINKCCYLVNLFTSKQTHKSNLASLQPKLQQVNYFNYWQDPFAQQA